MYNYDGATVGERDAVAELPSLVQVLFFRHGSVQVTANCAALQAVMPVPGLVSQQYWPNPSVQLP